MTQPVRTVDISHLLTNLWKPSELLVKTGAAKSRSEAKRLIKQRAVEIYPSRDSPPTLITSDKALIITDDMFLHAGKRFWRRLRTPKISAEIYEFQTREEEEAFLKEQPQLSPEYIERTLKEDWG